MFFSSCTHSHHNEVLCEVRQSSHFLSPAHWSWPNTACLQAKQVRRRRRPFSLMDKKSSRAHVLFINFSSAFSCIKLRDLHISPSLCVWILGLEQCALKTPSPPLPTGYAFAQCYSPFANGTTTVGCIPVTNSELITTLTLWCRANNLQHNVSKNTGQRLFFLWSTVWK